MALPDSITTWELQVITLSAATGDNKTDLGIFFFSFLFNFSFCPPGFCVVEPSEIRAFKKAFVSLRLPYSVRKYEQLIIAPVIYNYGHETLQVSSAGVDSKWEGSSSTSVSSALV